MTSWLLALSLILAYSPTDYALVQRTQAEQTPTDPQGKPWAESAALSWYDGNHDRIFASDQVQDPPLLAELTEHEVGNAEGDWHGLDAWFGLQAPSAQTAQIACEIAHA